jgi:hypothetical protein
MPAINPIVPAAMREVTDRLPRCRAVARAGGLHRVNIKPRPSLPMVSVLRPSHATVS